MLILSGIILVLLFAIGGSITVYCSQTYPDLRTSIALGKDLFFGFFSVTGILLAAESLRRSALSDRVSVALRIVERWNDPKNWEQWYALKEKLNGKPAGDLVTMLDNDSDRRTVVGVLNFLEEIASAVNAKAADDHQIWTAVGPTMVEYFRLLLPWVLYYRENERRPHAWVQAEKLMKRWQEVKRRT
jgi:hypothetical protein